MHCMGCGWDPCICSVSIGAGGGALEDDAARPPRVSVVPLPLSRARNGCRRTEPCVRGRRRPAWHCNIALPCLPSHSHVRTCAVTGGRYSSARCHAVRRDVNGAT